MIKLLDVSFIKIVLKQVNNCYTLKELIYFKN